MVSKLWNNYNSKQAYDGYFTKDNKLRKHATIISSILERYGKKKLQEIEKNCQSTISARGINFRVYAANNRAEQKKWPLDIIPRIIPKIQWNKVSKGLKQRSKALNLFIDDVYNQKKIFKDNIVPKEIIYNSPFYVKECDGFSPKYKAWANISGIDLIRNKNGDYLVLEDNLRVPSGVSYMLENRMVMRDVFPELFTRYKVSSIHQYTNKLYNCMLECIPKKTTNPHMVLLTPGVYNSAYFEHAYLAQQMGIDLVESSDLILSKDNYVYIKTISGRKRVDVIYRRVNDDYLDPTLWIKDSSLGLAGVINSWKEKKVAIVNAPGSGVADDKAVYAFVPKMIEFFLNEKPKLNQVKTYLCAFEKDKKFVLDNINKLVLKPVNESGGYGILIGPNATKKELEDYKLKIISNPRNFVAQPLIKLSTSPTLIKTSIQPRHIDLRPFILSGNDTFVTNGGLTRVALEKGSTIVNSSQGGGSKDTWVIN